VLVEHGVMWICDEERRLLARVNRNASRLYILDANIARPVCWAAHAKEDAWLWHAHFRHLNFGALRKMGRDELVRGMPMLDQPEQMCDSCLVGKHRRTPFPRRALTHSTEPLKLLHGDLCSPITPPTPSGNRYFLLLVDDYSRYMWIALLPSKDTAAAAIKRVQAAAELKTGKKLLSLCTDRGGEFLAGQFEEYCSALGIRREHTAPYSPQQNGVVERRNQTVVGTARCMLKAKQLPGMFWGEAVTTAVYLLNRSSSKSINGKTPYELWTGSPPGVQHLKTFGCLAHMKITTPALKKLDDRSRRTIFVGYEAGSKAYRLYDPVTQRVHISCDVIFDEGGSWQWNGELEDRDGDFVIEEGPMCTSEVITVPSPTPTSIAASPPPPSTSGTTPRHEEARPSPSTPAQAAEQQVEFATPPGSAEMHLDGDHEEDAPLRLCSETRGGREAGRRVAAVWVSTHQLRTHRVLLWRGRTSSRRGSICG
jgi:transposase InsO family protein